MPPQASGHIVVIFVLKIKADTSRRENIALEFKLPRENSRKFEQFYSEFEFFLFHLRVTSLALLRALTQPFNSQD